MGKIIVGMADLGVTSGDDNMLTTLGLGSCVGICLYDGATKIIGMAHCMLPDSKTIQNNLNIAKFIDTATIRLINDMSRIGANKLALKAKIAGGAQMFSSVSVSDSMRIGERNAEAAMNVLREFRIPVMAKDVGRDFGRTIEFYASDGRLVIKTIGHGTYTI